MAGTEGKDPLALCLEALQALYGSPDPVTKKQADDWLTQFQQTPQAWQVADQLLGKSDVPMQFQFFGAQTLRTKLQFDFYELPVEAYGSLRDSLLAHIDRFQASESHAIHTMLAIAIADLVIQMDMAWPNPIASCFERWGKPEGYSTLVEVLMRLAEENMNSKLMTDTSKRQSNRDMLKSATPNVISFLLNLQCPSTQAKRKVLECFLCWVTFTSLNPDEIAQNPLIIPECFRLVEEGSELSEIATDIIIELLRTSSQDLGHYEPVIKVILPLLSGLQAKFQKLMAQGAHRAVEMDRDGIQQICRIHVETGECLVPMVIEQRNAPQVVAFLEVLVQCTDLPIPEISSIPLDFWQRLAWEVSDSPEEDMMIDQFKGLFTTLLGVVIRRLTLNPAEDPFAMDDDLMSYRNRVLNLAEDCVSILTPNSALEHLLQSLQESQRQGVAAQEAHFCALTCVAPRARVQENSVLWQLIQSLPPLISQQVSDASPEANMLHFTKKTAIQLLGCLEMWVKMKPDFLKSSLDMISTLLMAPTPVNLGNSPAALERPRQVQQAASFAFKSICFGGRTYLQDLVDPLMQLYIQTMSLPIRAHLLIVEGVSIVVDGIESPDKFRSSLESLMTPLLTGMTSERDKPNVVGEILDRLQMVIRQVHIMDPSSSKAQCMGSVMRNGLFPLMKQTLNQHAADSKVVEKCCRVMKHSMRQGRDLFKPLIPDWSALLIEAFSQHQHSSYCYQAEILANEYGRDPEVVPALSNLFQHLSRIGLQCLMASQQRLEEITELVEDYFGMFHRFLRYTPMIVLEAPTLPPTLQLWQICIFVQQKDAIQTIVAFIESVLEHIAEADISGARRQQMIAWCGGEGAGRMEENSQARQRGQILHSHLLPVMPGFVEKLMRLIAGIPTKYVQEMLPSVFEHVRAAFPEQFPMYLQAAFQVLPPSVASPVEQQKFCEQLLRGNKSGVEEAVEDLCYRCEQVALRGKEKEKTGRKGDGAA